MNHTIRNGKHLGQQTRHRPIMASDASQHAGRVIPVFQLRPTIPNETQA
jgi:hypothetical protein